MFSIFIVIISLALALFFGVVGGWEAMLIDGFSKIIVWVYFLASSCTEMDKVSSWSTVHDTIH